jgi:hypothetical protein
MRSRELNLLPADITRVVARGGPILIMVFGFLISFIFREHTPFSVTGLGLILFGAAVEMYAYLQRLRPQTVDGDRSRAGSIARLQSEVTKLQSALNNRSIEYDLPIKQLRDELTRELTQTQLELQSNLANGLLTAEDRERVTDATIKALTQQTAASYLDKWEKEISRRVVDSAHIERIRLIGTSIQARLREEIDKLGRRANIQLIIGMIISTIGVAVLAWFVFYIPITVIDPLQRSELWFYFASRFTVVLFIEIFAYFFLRLYRYSIFEIKNFQNEITNSDFRIIALEGAMNNGDKPTIDKICTDMARTERNFILKKGETTLAIRSAELEQAADRNMGAYLDKLLQAFQKQAGGVRSSS